MRKMEELKDMLCEELEKITKKGELSAGSLDVIDKLTHSIKSIDTIIAMEDAGYSNDYYNDGNSYTRGVNMNGNSNARGRRRDSMGRYSRDGYSREDEYSMRRDGYSRDNEMNNLKMDLHDMLENANSEEERRMIRKWIHQVEE